MEKQELKQLVQEIVDEIVDELELEEFAQDTANIIVDLKHELEDLKDEVRQ